MIQFLRNTTARLAQQTASLLERVVRTMFGGAPNEHPTRVYWDDGVTLTLANLVQQTETRASGRVQVISLAEFRTSIGDLWDKYRDRILLIAESTIGRNIGRGSTFIPQSDDTWLMLFPGMPEEEAQARVDAIAAKIGEKLMGAKFTPEEPPFPATSKLDLGTAMAADGKLDITAVKAAVERVRSAQSGKPQTLSAKPTARPRAPIKIAVPMRPSAAAQMKIVFRPAWCAETQAVDTFFFRAFTDGGVAVFSERGPSLDDTTALDLVRMAVGSFRGMCAANLRAKFVVPLQFSALRSNILPDIHRTIADVPQRDRLLQLRIEIVGADRAPAELLIGIRELFRAYVREVAFMVNPFTLDDTAFALDHIMLGADVAHDGDHSDEEFFQAMLLFRQRAALRGTYVLGLPSRALMSQAVKAGIHEIGGPAFIDDLKRPPDRVTVLRREDLLLP